jgi:hypothetical protein
MQLEVKNMTELKQKQITENQRIRGPNLRVLIPCFPGVPFEEGLASANADDRVIASNKRMSQALVGSKEWKNISKVFSCWTGTMTAYSEPGKKLGKAVESVDSETGHRWVFPVPEEHQDKKDAILVTEHPDYTLEIDGKTRIVRAAQVDLIERFPAENGFYLGDVMHGIPTGEKVVWDDNIRYLFRTDSRVGPVVRGDSTNSCIDWRDFNLVESTSVALGVAAEAPDALLKGVTPEEFRSLVGEANKNLDMLAQFLKPESLIGMHRLLGALVLRGVIRGE